MQLPTTMSKRCLAISMSDNYQQTNIYLDVCDIDESSFTSDSTTDYQGIKSTIKA